MVPIKNTFMHFRDISYELGNVRGWFGTRNIFLNLHLAYEDSAKLNILISRMIRKFVLFLRF